MEILEVVNGVRLLYIYMYIKLCYCDIFRSKIGFRNIIFCRGFLDIRGYYFIGLRWKYFVLGIVY